MLKTCFCFICLIVLGSFTPVTWCERLSESGIPEIIVGTYLAPPFVMRDDNGVYSGLSIDLWQKVAKKNQLNYQLRSFDYDHDGMLAALQRNEIQIAIGPLSVNSSAEKNIDFTHPYFTAKLGVLIKNESSSLLQVLSNIRFDKFILTILALLTLLALVGTFIWLAERRRNATQFHPRPLPGVGDGVWWAVVTMTTTGYGDKAPITLTGRVISITWMLSSIFIAAFFSASLASSLVVNKLEAKIRSIQDLPYVRVANVIDTSAYLWLKQNNIKSRQYPFVIQAIQALKHDEVDALVYERSMTAYMLKEYGWKDLTLLPYSFAEHDYAFALSEQSVMRESINRSILDLIYTQEWQDSIAHYMGETN